MRVGFASGSAQASAARVSMVCASSHPAAIDHRLRPFFGIALERGCGAFKHLKRSTLSV